MAHDTSPLNDTAERFDRLAKSLKAAQFAATGASPPPEETMPAAHPEEAWSRRIATRIFTSTSKPAPPRLAACTTPADALPEPLPQAPVLQAAQAVEGGHIGSRLGKAGPRRSWVARLFRGR